MEGPFNPEDETIQSRVHNSEQVEVALGHRLYRQFGKRMCDFTFALVGLAVCAVPMLIVSILVRITSPGPALFCQLRAGRKGKMFVLFKFRSMYTNAPEKSNKDFSHDAMEHYVTKLGKFMRKTSIDELPQMINVLKGDMSFIGPRPLARTDDYVLSLRTASGADQIRPGISGLAQVNGRNKISDNQKASWDEEYVKSVSFSNDLKIILRTFGEVMMQHGIDKNSN